MVRKRIGRADVSALHPLEAYREQVACWCLRLLVPGRGHRFFVTRRGFGDDDILRSIGLEACIDHTLSKPEAMRLLKKQYGRYSRVTGCCSGVLLRNIAKLAAPLALADDDQEVLAFIALLSQDRGLKETYELFDCSSSFSVAVSLIAEALGKPRAVVKRSLASNSNLVLSGLIERSSRGRYECPFELMDGLAEELLFEDTDCEKILREFYSPGRPSLLTSADFRHLGEHLVTLKTYLDRASRRGTPGVNILLYGLPGTGKTELVRLLARELNMELYEVKTEDEDGDPLSGDRRFAAYRLCQRVLTRNPRALVLFDEVEDVFSGSQDLFGWTGREKHKGWVNGVLESNLRPAFWLSNSISEMDPAFLRRFDLILEMPELSVAARRRIAAEQLGRLNVSVSWLEQTARRTEIQPGHLHKAARVVEHLGYRKAERVEQALDQVLGNLYQALDLPVTATAAALSQGGYDPGLANTDLALEPVVAGLKRSGQGRLCLYGPPGTGKSGFAQHLAAALNRPLIAKKASDLLNAYLGGTESRLAAAFDEACKTGGVLLIDEADSFFRNRQSASHSWEVTQVNELLVQMEQFEGIFVAATNLMDLFDQAAMRRFDFKVCFGYLSAIQSERFMLRLLREDGSPRPAAPVLDRIRVRLAAMPRLTPGDFTTVKRRHRVLGQPLTADSLLEGLQAEQALKESREGRPIGFVV